MREAFWLAVASVCYGVDIWKGSRIDLPHTDAPCEACRLRGPWGQWRDAAARRSR